LDATVELGAMVDVPDLAVTVDSVAMADLDAAQDANRRHRDDLVDVRDLDENHRGHHRARHPAEPNLLLWNLQSNPREQARELRAKAPQAES
jgi:hypothetical protein